MPSGVEQGFVNDARERRVGRALAAVAGVVLASGFLAVDARATEDAVAVQSVGLSQARPTADSPATFGSDASRDLRDLAKDLQDLDKAVSRGSTFRALGNLVEIAFNVGQLKTLVPPAKVARDWQAGMAVLEKSTDAVSDAVSGDSSLGKTRRLIADASARVSALQKLVSRV